MVPFDFFLLSCAGVAGLFKNSKSFSSSSSFFDLVVADVGVLDRCGKFVGGEDSALSLEVRFMLALPASSVADKFMAETGVVVDDAVAEEKCLESAGRLWCIS